MSIRHNFTKYILSLFVCLLTIFATSCDMINTPVKDFFSNSAGLIAGQETDKSDGSSTEPGKSDSSEEVTNPDDSESDSTTDTPADTPSLEPEPGPVTPDTSEFDDIDLTTSLVYYVSSAGDDDASGEKDTPFQTIDKAFTSLKSSFQADTSKSAGYVLLLSDIEISQEIKLEDYNFGELSPNIVTLTIAGYGGIRTIDAKSNCRIMKIGYTNGEIKIKNLKFKGGYSDDVGGAGLYVSSSGINSMVFFTINNCIFTENRSSKSGAAIALETDYSVYIENCEISNNTCSDGASALDIKRTYSGSNFVLSDTSIIDNKTVADPMAVTPVYDYGYAVNTDGLANLVISGNVVIKKNSISQVSSSGDYSKLCVLKRLISISGKNNISNNSVYLTDFTELTRNLVVDASSGDTIRVVDDCSGSSIGIMNSTPISSETVFTYRYNEKTPAAPSAVFVCDGSYAIGYSSDGNEAAFVVNSGSFGNPLDNTMSFVMTQKIIPSGMASTLTVTPVVKNLGSDITASVLSDISWELTLMSGSVSIKTSTTNTLSISAAQALPDTYTLYVTATLNGIAYDESVSLVCKNTLEGMVSVSGASVNGAVADSGVFVTGRNLTIPAMYAGESELTQKEYLEYCYYAYSGKKPASPYEGDNYPACFVSWYDSIVYCNLRSMAEGLTPAYSMNGETDPRKWAGIESGSGTNAGKYCGPYAITTDWDNNIEFDTSANGWRMPVEAEWEYLARGGNLDSASQTTYAGSNNWEEVAWAGEGSTSTPHVVKQKAANSLGLYDMSGNVYEYVWDWFGGNIDASVGAKGCTTPIMTYKETDTGPVTLTPTTIVRGNARMVRGGAFNYGSNEARISDRSVNNTPDMRWANCGVRIVRNAD